MSFKYVMILTLSIVFLPILSCGPVSKGKDKTSDTSSGKVETGKDTAPSDPIVNANTDSSTATDSSNNQDTPPSDDSGSGSQAASFKTSSVQWFDESSNDKIGKDYILIKSLQNNRITILYRAKYADPGLWQLYARGVTVSVDGTMTLDSAPKNLLPSCNGNEDGVTAFAVTEYRDSTGSNSRVFSVEDAENITDFKVVITCINTAQSEEKKFDAIAYNISTAATNKFQETAGAVGHWSTKNIYLKGDGSSLKPDGSVASTVLSLPQGYQIKKVIGSDTGGVYLWLFKSPSTYSCKYAENDLQIVATSISCAYNTGIYLGSFNDKDNNLLILMDWDYVHLEKWANNILMSKTNGLSNGFYYNNYILLERSNKILFGYSHSKLECNTHGDDACRDWLYLTVGPINLLNGTVTPFSPDIDLASFDSSVKVELYGKRAIFLNDTKIAITTEYFTP